jgi:hypothetical protein
MLHIILKKMTQVTDTFSDTKIIALAALFALLPAMTASAYFVTYKEQYYRLFHVHLQQTPDDIIENIYWLEKALAAPFCNPLFALAHIENEVQWEKYRNLFMMHLNIKMTEQHLRLGSKWNKRHAYFYNAPFRDMVLDSLETAEICFNAATYYWEQAREWAQKANAGRFRWINLQRVQFWEDEAARIQSGALNYGRTINRELTLLQHVRRQFQDMDENTY